MVTHISILWVDLGVILKVGAGSEVGEMSHDNLFYRGASSGGVVGEFLGAPQAGTEAWQAVFPVRFFRVVLTPQ